MKIVPNDNYSIGIRLSCYKGAHLLDCLIESCDTIAGEASELTFEKARWRCQVKAVEIPGRQDAVDLEARFAVVEGVACQVSAGVTPPTSIEAILLGGEPK